MRKLAARSSNTRKIVGSLAIAGTAAAVAGLGTYGSFTSSTTPVSTQVGTGSVNINLAQAGSYSIPAATTGFVPGDSLSRAVTLTNTGTSALGTVSLTSTAATPSLLTTDTTNGLQLTVRSCPVAWTEGGTAGAPVYTCTGTVNTLVSGPAVGNAVLPGPNSLKPGGVDHLVISISLPESAGNTFQNLTSALSLTFTGTQATGGAR